MRFVPYILSIVATVVFCYLAIEVSMWFYLGVGICGAGALLGTYDLIQTKHSLLRNYPLQGASSFFSRRTSTGVNAVLYRKRYRWPSVRQEPS